MFQGFHDQSHSDVKYINLMTAFEVAEFKPELSRLAQFYEKTELKFKLEQSRHITVLMPTDKAFVDFPINLEYLSYKNVQKIMSNLIIPEVVKVNELSPGKHRFTTLGGERITFDIPNKTNKLSNTRIGKARVLSFVDNANGMSYEIDTILLPQDMNIKTLAIEENRNRLNQHSILSSSHNLLVPTHVKETNRMHAKYDVTPKFHITQVDDLSDSNTVIGVIKPKPKSLTSDTEESFTPVVDAVPAAPLRRPLLNNRTRLRGAP